MAQGECKLIVYGVAFNASETEIKQEFRMTGTVTDASNPGNGYAFVTMSTYEEAISAKKLLEGSNCLGGTLKIDLMNNRSGSILETRLMSGVRFV